VSNGTIGIGDSIGISIVVRSHARSHRRSHAGVVFLANTLLDHNTEYITDKLLIALSNSFSLPQLVRQASNGLVPASQLIHVH
jgi:hypothetical protein